MTQDELDQIAIDVRDAAYKVIQGKGATNYAIGLSSARIVEAILNDEHAVMPVSPVLHDFHGVDGVALSVPSIVSAAGAVPIRETQFAPNELELFHRSADGAARGRRLAALTSAYSTNRREIRRGMPRARPRDPRPRSPAGTSSARNVTSVPPSTGSSDHVMSIVPANAGSSESNSTACTTRTPGTSSTKRASTTSESAVVLPAPSARRRSDASGSRRRASRRSARTRRSCRWAAATRRAPRDR